jgi:hypothetical protein
MPMINSKDRNRFASYFYTFSDGCWEWQGSLTSDGYGKFAYNGGWLLAHRVAYEIEHHQLDPEILVCHTCDNRKCVNPKHLFIGTKLDNARDMVSKDRQHKLLTSEDIATIRRLHSSGVVQRRLAEHFGVSYSAICKLIKSDRGR